MSETTELSTLFSSIEEEEQFIAEGDLEMLLDEYTTPSKLSQYDGSKDSKIIKSCKPMDILIGRFVSHPGNVLARKVICTNRDFFRSLEGDIRKDAVDATVAFFESKGARFLEPVGKNNGSFRAAKYFNVAEKFRKSLRETGIRADRPPPRKIKKPQRAAFKTSNKKLVPVKVQKKAKSNPPRNTAPPDGKSRSGLAVVFHPRQVKPGDRLGIFWPEDGVYYPGTVTSMSGTQVRFHYDDGERETVDISNESFVILGKSPRDRSKENKIQPTNASAIAKKVTRRVSLPSKESPDNSVHTQSSSGSLTSSMEAEAQPVSIHIQGTFPSSQAAPAPSFAAFLLQKLKKSSV